MRTKMTRRALLASSAALPLALRALAQPPAAPRWVFLGTDKGPGISRCSWDASSGRLGPPELAAKADHPDFFALHPKLPLLYTVNSSSGQNAAVAAFHVDARSGSLKFAGQQSSLGDGPCFVSVDATGQSAFAANYSGGSFTAYALGADGLLKPPTGSLDCRHNPACGTQGPVADRQDASHMHCATVSPGNDFVLACDLGNDNIEVFAIHPGVANPLGAVERVAARPGSGPRHLAFHPNRRWVYVMHELDCTIEIFDWAVHGGKANLARREGTVVSTLPKGVKPNGATGCEILVADNGRFVYTSTRKVDSLEVYAVDAKTGKLTEKQRVSCGGAVPRHIAFDPSRRWLLCTNQGSSTVTVFAHNARTGELRGPVQTIASDSPMFVQFV